jgi:MFS family permease
MKKRPFFERLAYTIVLGLTAKLLIDTTVQLFNPFLPIFAGGLGVSIIALGRLVGLRQSMGLLAPVFGTLADRIGHRYVLQIGLVLAGIGNILIGFDLGLPGLVAGMVLSGIGVSIYAPNLHAYLGGKLEYHRRSRVMGIIEYSWALAGIVGLSISGLLIETVGWNTPFFIIGIGLILYALFFFSIPVQKTAEKALHETKGGAEPDRTEGPFRCFGLFNSIKSFFDLGENARSAWGAVAVSGFNFFAVTNVLLAHGQWLSAEYGVTAGRLGLIALVLGCFDWAASITVSVAGDRIGKKRSVFIGVAGTIIGYVLLPFLNSSLSAAVAGIIIPRFFFEFATVSNFPLLSEQVPEQRGKLMSLSITAGLIGTTAAGITGPWLYATFGVWGLGPVSLAASVCSLAAVSVLVKDAQ